jgi:hypothetical protein
MTDDEYIAVGGIRTDSGNQNTRQVHKVSFPLLPQLANLILREVTAHT